MNYLPLISVIVPVFKVEQYLAQCVESIVNQTYKNLEIILVDDGSPDNCPAMCDEWAKRDNRIKVIHKENGGLSDARNAGMKIASGGYIGFVDSDDWLRNDMYELLYKHLKENDVDISACGVEMIFDNGEASRMLTKDGTTILNTNEAVRSIIQESWLKQPVWYKLYRSSIIKDILFPVGKYHEDVFWSYQAVAKANKVCVFDEPCYFYRQRNESIMGQTYSLKRLDAIEAKTNRLEFIYENFPEFIRECEMDLVFSCLYHGQLAQIHLNKTERVYALEHLNRAFKEVDSKLSPNRISQKLWFLLSKISFGLTCRIRTLLRIGL